MTRKKRTPANHNMLTVIETQLVPQLLPHSSSQSASLQQRFKLLSAGVDGRVKYPPGDLIRRKATPARTSRLVNDIRFFFFFGLTDTELLLLASQFASFLLIVLLLRAT